LKPRNLFANAVRGKEILTVLIRYGFGDVVETVGLPRRWVARFIPEEQSTLNLYQRLRKVCEDLGPTFVKMGQILSTRPDVLPEPLIAELKLLRDKVPPIPWDPEDAEGARDVLLEELDGSIEEYFSEFNTEPFAAGSLAQVHRARLVSNGQEVAVKIQRPGIRKAIRSDIEILLWLAQQLHERVAELTPYDLPTVIGELREGIFQELDFCIEGRNAEFFNRTNKYPDKVFAPAVHWELTTRRLGVWEFVHGQPPGTATLDSESARKLAKDGASSVFHQIFISGFFHGDPHPGNILITPDRRIVFIDWGLAGHLTRDMRYFLADLFSAISSQSAEKIVRIVTSKAHRHQRVDQRQLERAVSLVLRKYTDIDKQGVIGNVMMELLYVFGMNGIHLSRDYSLLAKAVLSIEETAVAMDPDFSVSKVGKPLLDQLNWERWNPRNLLRQTCWQLSSAADQIRDLPAEIQRVMRRIDEGVFSINLQHKNLEKLSASLEHVANRVAFALITGALIIGSSTVIDTQLEPQLWGHSALGIIGYVGAGVLGFWVLIDMIRHGRHR